MISRLLPPVLLLVIHAACSTAPCDTESRGPVFELVCAPGLTAMPFEGRALVFLSKIEAEPRTSNNPARLEPVLAADFASVPPGRPMRIDASNVLSFPASPAKLEGGTYWAQAVLDVQSEAPWPGTAPGNPCSEPVRVELGAGRQPTVRLVCDRLIPEVLPEETRYVRRVDFTSPALSAFHGRPVHLRALVHLPAEWFQEAERRFPMYLYLSGFGASLSGFQSVDWPAPPIAGEPFVAVYPDPSCSFGHSAFANSDVNGPWGDALVDELLPLLEERFRCAPGRESRILAGHSSGGWGALALIIRRPAVFGVAWVSSPDPVDFRDFMGVDLYADGANMYRDEEQRPRPFCMLGDWTVNYTREHARREEVLRGGALAYFEALLGPRAPDGGPEPLFDRETGDVDPRVVSYWRRQDLSRLLRERWDELAPLLDGRLVVTMGDRDNFLLQRSVELMRRDLERLGADIDVHMLSGDHFSRLDGARSAEQARQAVDRFRTSRSVGAHAADGSDR